MSVGGAGMGGPGSGAGTQLGAFVCKGAMLVTNRPVHRVCKAFRSVELVNNQFEGDDVFPCPSPNF
eukprot:151529-Ditylum_brightwellii.AAC.1